MEEYCTNCGAKITANSKFCPECGKKMETKTNNRCPKCGNEIEADEEFCSKCGEGLKPKTASIKKEHKIIIVALGIVIIVLAGLLLSGAFTNNDIPLGNKDFGGITMLVPVGSNFVESNSLPDYGVGGFVMYKNTGKYSHDAFTITFSTTIGKGAPSSFILDRQDGDISIYKDANGEDGLYMIREVGGMKVDIIGGNEEVMKKMLNSVEISSTYSID